MTKTKFQLYSGIVWRDLRTTELAPAYNGKSGLGCCDTSLEFSMETVDKFKPVPCFYVQINKK